MTASLSLLMGASMPHAGALPAASSAQTVAAPTNPVAPVITLAPNPNLFPGSAAYTVLDATTGEVLASNNTHQLLEPASMMKLMTSLMAIERLPLDQMVTVSPAAGAREQGELYIHSGEQFTIEKLLEAALIPSDNNAAYALADAVSGGDLAKWTQMARDRSALMGFEDAGVVFDPTGWIEGSTAANDAMLSAADMAKLALTAFHNPEIRRIIGMSFVTITGANGVRRSAGTTDLLLGNFVGMVGGKTGTTNSAGRCFSAIAKRGNREILTVVFKSPDRMGQTADALDWAYGWTPGVYVTGGIAQGTGYLTLHANGTVGATGGAAWLGNATLGTGDKAVGIASTPDGLGYWIALASGDVQAFGTAKNLGTMYGTKLNGAVISMAATASGQGYWLVASDGGIFSFGDAAFYGSMGAKKINQPVVGMASSPTSHGYWLVASDGGIFAFGDAHFYGSMGGVVLNRPVIGIMRSGAGGGYLMVASDGGIFTFGDSKFLGSTGAVNTTRSVRWVVPTADGNGYWLLSSTTGAWAFGAAAA